MQALWRPSPLEISLWKRVKSCRFNYEACLLSVLIYVKGTCLAILMKTHLYLPLPDVLYILKSFTSSSVQETIPCKPATIPDNQVRKVLTTLIQAERCLFLPVVSAWSFFSALEMPFLLQELFISASEQQEQKLPHLLLNYQSIFGASDKDLGCTYSPSSVYMVSYMRACHPSNQDSRSNFALFDSWTQMAVASDSTDVATLHRSQQPLLVVSHWPSRGAAVSWLEKLG